MRLHHSNHLSTLADALAALLATPPPTPFHHDALLTPAPTTARWLSLQLARRLGLWANPHFLTLRDLPTLISPGNSSSLLPPDLTWPIAAALPDLLPTPAFAPLRAYLADDTDATKRLPLARRIAATFDRYTRHRPDLLRAWERNEATHWQAALWRALRDASAQRAPEPQAPAPAPPHRLCVFNVHHLSPTDAELLAAVPCDVHLFTLSPSPTAWAAVHAAPVTALPEDSATERDGHPLLTSLGRLARDTQRTVTARLAPTEHPAYLEPTSGSMLAALQSDLLADHARAALPIARSDRSIAVHSCHGPMREVEVLRDQLLALFQADPTLEARDVLVLCPELETYAPFVEAVFGGDGGARLPFKLVDRPVRAGHAVVDAFLAILEILPGRFAASEIVDLLSREPIRARFGLDETDLDLVRTWIDDSGIRWGVDETHRAEVGQPPLRENTWAFGLDRLLLGYAMPAKDHALFHGVFPSDDVEGGSARALGQLAEFCEALFAARAQLSGRHTLATWRERLGAALERLVHSHYTTAHEHQLVRSALADLTERAEAAGFTEEVPLDLVTGELESAFGERSSTHGFASGAITFCAAKAGRCVPSRVICLLGMDDGAFPRQDRPMGFDLLAQEPRRGDPSTRDEDRFLFLEALLAARDHFLVTYTGQSIQNNAERPPSVVVSELLDVLDESFAVDGAKRAREHVVVAHPLHAFSPRYFTGDDRLFSHSAALCQGARASLGERQHAPPFAGAPLPGRKDATDTIALADLVAFFQHPLRSFVKGRVGVTLGRDLSPLADREPLELDGLDGYLIGTELLERHLAGASLEPMPPDLRARGVLPFGPVGRADYAKMRPAIAEFAAAVQLRWTRPRPPPLEIDITLRKGRITGWLPEVGASGQILFQFANLKGKQRIAAWVQHLALLCTVSDARSTWLVARTKTGPVTRQFGAVPEPLAVLESLVELYRRGLTEALPLFPDPALTYVDYVDAEGQEGALGRARAAFGGDYGDVHDPYVQKIYADTDPFDAAFGALAARVYGPLVAHEEEIA